MKYRSQTMDIVSYSNGTPVYAMALSNDSDVIAISANTGAPLGDLPSITVQTFYGNEEKTDGEVTISAIGCKPATLSGRIYQMESLGEANTGSITFTWKPNGAGTTPVLTKTFTFNVITSNADYDLIIPQTVFNTKNNNVTVSVNVLKKAEGSPATTIAPNGDNNIIVQYKQANENSWTSIKSSSVELEDVTASYTFRIIKAVDKDQENPFVWDSETVEFVSDGAAERDFNITASSYVLVKDADGVLKGSKITLTAHPINLPYQNENIHWYKDDILVSGVTGLIYENIEYTGKYTAKIWDEEGQLTEWQDSVVIGETQDGATGKDAISITLSNPNVTFHEQSADAPEYCSVIVYEGGTLLSYGAGVRQYSISDCVNCNWDSEKQQIKITDKTENGTATFKVHVKTSSGETSTKDMSISYKIISDAKDLNLQTTHYFFTKHKDGTISPSAITLTAQSSGLSGDHTWYKNGTSVANETNNTYTLSQPNSETTYTIKVERNGLEDTLNIGWIDEAQDGQDAIGIQLTNPSMTFNSSTSSFETTTAIVMIGTKPAAYSINTPAENSGWTYTLSKASEDVDISEDGTITIPKPNANTSYGVVIAVYYNGNEIKKQTINIQCTIVDNGSNAVDYKVILTPTSFNLTTSPNQTITGQILQISGSKQEDITNRELEAGKVFFKYSGGAADSSSILPDWWYPINVFSANWIDPRFNVCQIAYCVNRHEGNGRFPKYQNGTWQPEDILPESDGDIQYIYYYASVTAIKDGTTPELPDQYEYIPTYIYYSLSTADFDGPGLPDYPVLPEDGPLPETTLTSMGWQTRLPNQRVQGQWGVFRAKATKKVSQDAVIYIDASDCELYMVKNNIGADEVEYAKYYVQTKGDRQGIHQDTDGNLYIVSRSVKVLSNDNETLFEANGYGDQNGNRSVYIGGWNVSNQGLYHKNNEDAVRYLLSPDQGMEVEVPTLSDNPDTAWSLLIGDNFGIQTDGGVVINKGSISLGNSSRQVVQRDEEISLMGHTDLYVMESAQIKGHRDVYSLQEIKKEDVRFNFATASKGASISTGVSVDNLGNNMYRIKIIVHLTNGTGQSLPNVNYEVSYIVTIEKVISRKEAAFYADDSGAVKINTGQLNNFELFDGGFRVSLRDSGGQQYMYLMNNRLYLDPENSTFLEIQKLDNSDKVTEIPFYVRPTGFLHATTISTTTVNATTVNYAYLNQGSDFNLKKDIVQLPNSYSTFFDSLVPVSYKYLNDNSETTRIGFIAQEVQRARDLAGLTEKDFYVGVDDKGYLNLNYIEFIALNTHQIQLLKPRMIAAEEKIAALELEISSLKSELENLKSPQNSDII